MRRMKKVLALVLILTMVLPGLAQAASPAVKDKKRIEGSNRYLTAVEASKLAYDKAKTVVLATGEDHADALTGTVLAAKEKAPLLLTRKAGVEDYLLDELLRLGAEKIIILGGESAVSANVVAQLKKQGLEVERVFGDNRYATAIKVAERLDKGNLSSKDLGSSKKKAFLVSGVNFKDAMSIGPVAARDGLPILLTRPGELVEAVGEALRDLGIEEVEIIGGSTAVAKEVAEEIQGMGITTKRLAGDNAIETSLAIAERYFPNPEIVLIASNANFADGLVGGYLAALLGGPILLTKPSQTDDGVVKYIRDAKVKAYVLGGKDAVSNDVVGDIAAAVEEGRKERGKEEEKEETPNNGGGGGGGYVPPSDVKVSGISVSVKDNAEAKITTDGGTLEMEADVEPSHASNKNVTWSVDDSNKATIDANTGLLTAVANGTVTVTATAKDGSGVKGTVTITISNQVLVDKSDLTTAVSDAILLNEFVEVSVDGTDVATCKYWATSAVKNAYEKAIDDAQAVANKANASQAEIKQAIKDLETAMGVFYEGLEPGTKVVAISKITEITITEVTQPHHGKNVNFDYIIPSNANYIKIGRGEWYYGSKRMKETDTFLSGEKYKFVATLAAKPCYEFDSPENLSAKIDGNDASEIKKINEDGFIEITYEFTATGPEIHYVNFHSDDWHDQVIVEDGGTISLPEPPAKDGYTFGGWYTEKDGKGKEFTASTPVTAEFSTLHAKWILITYTVSFDSDNGSEVHVIKEVVPKATVTLPTPPTKDGFDFGGWYTAKNGTGTEFTASTPVTGDITLYAKWTGKDIPVTAISVKGTGDVSTIKIDGGTLQMIATVEPATASNQKVYWSIKESKIATINSSGLLTAVANGTVTVTAEAVDGSDVIGTAEIVISGQPKFSLIMTVEGSGTVTPANSDYKYERESTVEIEAKPTAGWYFEKWEGDVKESNKTKTTVTMSEAKTVKAVFVQGENTTDFAGGHGTSDSPYKVANPEHLNNVRNYLDAHFIQTAGIDLENFDFKVIGDYVYSRSFEGNYDGDGKEIKNLKIIKSGGSIGLFAYNKGTIENVKLRGCEVKTSSPGTLYIGSLVGRNEGEIINSSATGQVTGYDIVGGLVGNNKNKISGSYATCQVKSSLNPSRTGGLVGLNSGEINKSYATGDVTGSGNSIGGLVGENSGQISESYATGNVAYEGNSGSGFGGLVGENNGTISKSYATGKVAGGYSRTGGLVGDNEGKIEESYATGQVTGQHNLGGLVGYSLSSGEISKSYWDKESSGQDKSSGSDESFGKTTEDMKKKVTYEGWDFNSTWSINANSYPILKW